MRLLEIKGTSNHFQPMASQLWGQVYLVVFIAT